jgi:hypothetical protein
MVEVPWGRIWRSWPEVVMVTQPPGAKLRYNETGKGFSGRDRGGLHDR